MSALVDQIPSRSELARNFAFIKNRALRNNIAVHLRYLTFLIVVREQEKLRGSIAGSIYKDVIIYTTSIVEGCLHYLLHEFNRQGMIDAKSMCESKWTEASLNVLHVISEDELVCGVVQRRKFEEITPNLQLQTILRISLRAKILSKALFNDCDALKTMRNKIHLAGLKAVDGHYSKKDIEFAFQTAERVIKKVRARLTC